MGFCMNCKTTGISCCYSTWSEKRIAIAKATVKYLQAKFPEIELEIERIKENGLEDEEYIDGYPTFEYERFIKELSERLIPLTEKVNNKDIISVMTFFKGISSDSIYYIKDGMVCFGIYGLYSLCKQGDCEGAYSVGESHDILELLRVIKPYFDKETEDDKYMYDSIYNNKTEFSSAIYDIFYDSISTYTPVYIS